MAVVNLQDAPCAAASESSARPVPRYRQVITTDENGEVISDVSALVLPDHSEGCRRKFASVAGRWAGLYGLCHRGGDDWFGYRTGFLGQWQYGRNGYYRVDCK